MKSPPGRLFRATLSGPRLAVALVVGAVALTNVWSGCTVTKSNYKTLSLFFDGVPDPNAPAGAVDPSTGVVSVGASVSIHPPYAQDNCSECHRARVRMTRNDSGLCMKCHAGKEREYERMHGPVAAQACLWCHHPHESQQKHLMRGTDRVVCSQCHMPELLNAERVPEHADAARGCLECHSGHGGARAFLLRDSVASLPASTPASASAPAPAVAPGPADVAPQEGK